jgi:hypothetical protein
MYPLTSFAALQDAVLALPPVPRSKVRVFRGQTTSGPLRIQIFPAGCVVS